jgi:hypothetical protein
VSSAAGGGGSLSSPPAAGAPLPKGPSSNHSAFEVLGLGASAGAGHGLNLLVVGRECVEQFLVKDSRLLRLKHPEYHDLISEGALGAGVRWKSCDTVGYNPVDVADRLGAHIVGWLVVGGLDGRELLMQQRVNGVVLGIADLQLLHGLATGENIEHVSSEHVVWL